MPATNPIDAKRLWFEPACAVLMAVASIATAWCSYQSSSWSEESRDLSSQATKLRGDVNEQHLEARQIESTQMRLFMEAIDAQMEGDEKRARFYTDRFADELKPAYEKWIALKPLDNPEAPPTPFAPGLYVPRFEKEIRDGRAKALSAEHQSKFAGHMVSSYLGNTVSLATVLLFAATAEKFVQRRVRWSALAFAIMLLLYAALRTLMLPVT